MHGINSEDNHQILIIDDNPSIHEDIKQILGSPSSSELENLSASLFGESAASPTRLSYAIDSAYQGQEGLEKVIAAVQHQRPYALGFVDMRMPPGWDGIETIEHVWQVDPELQIVICTAYSDYSWAEISARLGATDQLLILKKPFDIAEVCQLAAALTRKWNLSTQHKTVDRLKDELIATVSHELRTPLASLQGFTEIMLHRDYPPEKQRQFLTIMHQESLRLIHLINDLLDVQCLQLGAPAYTFTHVYLEPLVDKALAVFCHENNTHTFSVAGLDTLPPLRADEDRLCQVLTNLLANAVKFSPDGGEVCVGARQEGATVVVWVVDPGIGMPLEAMSNLFTPFYRVDNTATRRIGGSGLGLALVKKIVEAHDGQVWVESEPGKGSTFFLRLPVSDTAWQVRDSLSGEAVWLRGQIGSVSGLRGPAYSAFFTDKIKRGTG